MMSPVEPIVTMSEVHAYLRIESGDEEGLLAGLVRTASQLCEDFLNQVVIAREFEEQLAASTTWQPLRTRPIRAIDGAGRASGLAPPQELAASDYAVDLDCEGRAWLKYSSALTASKIMIWGTAGLALDQNDVPEPIRQGVLRMVAYLHASRDGDGGGPPATVTALWRPYRKLAFS